jgi:hypothetical protein
MPGTERDASNIPQKKYSTAGAWYFFFRKCRTQADKSSGIQIGFRTEAPLRGPRGGYRVPRAGNGVTIYLLATIIGIERARRHGARGLKVCWPGVNQPGSEVSSHKLQIEA